MKSIVLCENTLLKIEDDTKNLKENIKSEQVKESSKKLNGSADDKKSKAKVDASESEKSKNLQNGSQGKTEEVVKPSENGKDTTAEKSGNSERGKCGSGDPKSMAVTTVKSENCLVDTKYSFDVSENLKARNGSKENSDSENDKGNVNSFDEVSNDISEVLIIEDSAMQVAKKNGSKCVDKGFKSDVLPKTKVEESGQPLHEEIFDVDSNKENEKEEKTNSVEDSGKDGEEEGISCEIQVEKVQSVSSQDSDFVWLQSDTEKSHQDGEEISQEREVEEPEEGYTCREDSQKSCEEDKETDCQELVGIDSLSAMHVDSEELQMEVEEADQGVEINEDDGKSYQTEWEEPSEETECKKAEEDNDSSLTVSNKRPLENEKEESSAAKKLKLSEKEKIKENAGGLKIESLTGGVVEEGSPNVVDETCFEEAPTTENVRKSEKESESEVPASSFLASFRGTLKNMTRSDLEELIVQKLCEVITERSNVGELRRKAQALEQDQERWKLKVHALTKQMKEMEMVMKKYMSEVQKQLKDGTGHMTTPLRVTRSVGLQVSFYTYPNRGSKPSGTPSTAPSPAQGMNTRSSKGSLKPSPQYTPVSHSLRSKSTPVTPKNSPTVQKAPVTQQRRHSVVSTSAPPTRTTTTVPVTNRQVQNQVSGPRPTFKTAAGAAQQQQVQQQQQQQQQGSKVIDLTDDDDQRVNNTGKQSNTTTRVVSHLPQVQPGTPANSRFAYLVPATSTSTGIGGTSNRQVLIATPTIQTAQPNRQIMCSMPPLLFKGGNQVQPAAQQQAINQANSRVILPKVLRHPAPLPQAPIRNWANMKQLPPRPALKISKVQTGIVLSWNMVLGPEHAPIRSYQLYAYQESNSPPVTSLWKKVGDVKALPLPMACTLTQFMSGHKYHFAVRAVDLHSRIGPFSFPGTIVLDKGR